jgi:integrase
MNNELFIPKTEEERKKVEDLLLKHSGTQIRDLWRLGLLLGCRINELLQIKFSDLNDDSLQIQFLKTRHNNMSNISLTPEAKEVIINIKNQYPQDEFVFQSHDSKNIKDRESKPISRQAVYRAFKKVGVELGVKLTPQTMRHAAAMQFIANFNSSIALSKFMGCSKFTSEALTSYYVN